MGIGYTLHIVLATLSVICVSSTSNIVEITETKETHVVSCKKVCFAEPISTYKTGLKTDKHVQTEEKGFPLSSPTKGNNSVNRHHMFEVKSPHHCGFSYERINEKSFDETQDIQSVNRPSSNENIEKVIIKEIFLNNVEKIDTSINNEHPKTIEKPQEEETYKSNLHRTDRYFNLDLGTTQLDKSNFEKEKSPSLSSGHGSLNDEDNDLSNKTEASDLDSGININFRKFEMVIDDFSSNFIPLNSFVFDEKPRKFLVCIDEQFMKNFEDNISLQNMDMSNDMNIFMGNFCVSFLIHLLNKGNVFLKRFVGECRILEETLKLSLYNKNMKISLLDYIKQKFEILGEISPKDYKLNESKFYFNMIQKKTSDADDIYNHINGLSKGMFSNYINQYVRIGIVHQPKQKDGESICKYAQEMIFTKFVNFTRRCYVDLLNYIVCSILTESIKVNDNIYQKQVKKLI